MVVAPATANVIAKFAKGIADDMLSTTYLACNAQKLICPAMNCNMYEDAATQENMRILKDRGVMFCDSAVGLLACGDVGKGRMAEPKDIVDKIVECLTPVQDFHGKRVLVTAGGTQENIDAVRVIANHSSGKWVLQSQKRLQSAAVVWSWCTATSPSLCPIALKSGEGHVHARYA